MWLMLQSDHPEDYILATNEMHSVREFVELAFKIKGINIIWRGSGLHEVGYDPHTDRILVKVSSKYFRPAEVEELLGDSTKAKRELGWEPSTTFKDLVHEMVMAE